MKPHWMPEETESLILQYLSSNIENDVLSVTLGNQ